MEPRRQPAARPRQRLQELSRPKPRRFHGSVTLDATRVGRDASRIAEEVIAHSRASSAPR